MTNCVSTASSILMKWGENVYSNLKKDSQDLSLSLNDSYMTEGNITGLFNNPPTPTPSSYSLSRDSRNSPNLFENTPVPAPAPSTARKSLFPVKSEPVTPASEEIDRNLIQVRDLSIPELYQIGTSFGFATYDMSKGRHQ